MSLPPPELTGAATRVLGGLRCPCMAAHAFKAANFPRQKEGKKDSELEEKSGYSSLYAGPMVPLMRCSPSVPSRHRLFSTFCLPR